MPRASAAQPASPTTSGFFQSARASTLWWLTVLVWLPVPLTAWLRSLESAPQQGWETSPLGRTL